MTADDDDDDDDDDNGGSDDDDDRGRDGAVHRSALARPWLAVVTPPPTHVHLAT